MATFTYESLTLLAHLRFMSPLVARKASGVYSTAARILYFKQLHSAEVHTCCNKPIKAVD